MALLTHAEFTTAIELQLEDSAFATFSEALIDDRILDGLDILARESPYNFRESFNLESRTGTATSTSSGNLVDATESQFVAGDVNKVIYNITDRTWAIVTTFTSTTTVALSKDIMTSGDQYAMFNKGCRSNLEINIANITNFLKIREVEYPVVGFNESSLNYPWGFLGYHGGYYGGYHDRDPNFRNFELGGEDGRVLRLDLALMPDDTADSDADKEVYVHFHKKHWITQMTDLAGTIAASVPGSYPASALTIDDLQSSGTIEKNTEFTIAGIRGVFWITTDATISTNSATISFYPPLDETVTENDVVTFKQSSLEEWQERIFIKMVAGMCAMGKSIGRIDKSNTGGPSAARDFMDWGTKMYDDAITEFRRQRPPETSETYSRYRNNA